MRDTFYGVNWCIILINDYHNDQIDIERVRISWEGMLHNANCADWMRVKYWKSSGSDIDYDISQKLDKTARSFIVSDLSPYRSYTFQVSKRTSRHK